MDCAEARENLTALADRALAAAESEAVRGHVRACAGCAEDLAGVEATVALAHRALAEALPALRPGFETRMRALLADEAAPARFRWWRPLFAGTLAAVAVVLFMARTVGGPSAVLVPLGIQAPPRQVAESPVLFKDYEIIEHLEEFEHFETVIQVPLEPEITGERRGAG